MIFWRLMTIVFGAVPATWLAFFAGMAAYSGAQNLFAVVASGDPKTLPHGILLVSWGGLGLIGTISLWAVGLGFTQDLWREGLKGGVVAAFPILLSVVTFGKFDLLAAAALLATAIAIYWLADFRGWSSTTGDAAAEDELRGMRL